MRSCSLLSRRRRGGFTLLETLIVIMYIAIMASIVLPKITGAGRRASETNLKATLREIRNAVASYQAETGLYPLELVDIMSSSAPDTGITAAGIEVPIMAADFHGPYLIPGGARLPMDRATGRREWDYSTTPPYVGRVRSLATGITLDGEPYSSL
jgi:prepilin-type N-terminal cleavage/methylation domain-containing protein